MRKTRVWITLGFCLFAVAIFAWAQSRKAGLYEVTTTMTWQKSPLPPGMQAPPGSPFGGAPRTNQVCVTQAMIDKYGGPISTPQRGDCQVTGVSMKANGMSASIACTGQMQGSGTVEATWTDASTSHSNVHFSGSMQMGPRSTPIEWTMESTSVFKGADCGSVKPIGPGAGQ